ncbi:Phospholipase A and acyltransferase 2 [Bulinus truncatus]|nr:Phospholipase A and acyltransferase 2 [Bulinus truncatus]
MDLRRERIQRNESNKLEFNGRVLRSCKVGDRLELIRCERIYSHWAICIGDGKIIHLWTASENDMYNWNSLVEIVSSIFKLLTIFFWSLYFEVREDDSKKFVEECVMHVDNSMDQYTVNTPHSALNSDEIVQYAKSQLHRRGYNLFLYNCEHFVNRCRYGYGKWDIWTSDQVC